MVKKRHAFQQPGTGDIWADGVPEFGIDMDLMNYDLDQLYLSRSRKE